MPVTCLLSAAEARYQSPHLKGFVVFAYLHLSGVHHIFSMPARRRAEASGNAVVRQTTDQKILLETLTRHCGFYVSAKLLPWSCNAFACSF